MITPPHLHKPDVNDYLNGFILAIVLTVFAFGLAIYAEIDRFETIMLVAALAFVQILVHIRYFLHYSTKRVPIEATVALVLASAIGIVLIAGCMWVIVDLHHRMMP